MGGKLQRWSSAGAALALLAAGLSAPWAQAQSPSASGEMPAPAEELGLPPPPPPDGDLAGDAQGGEMSPTAPGPGNAGAVGPAGGDEAIATAPPPPPPPPEDDETAPPPPPPPPPPPEDRLAGFWVLMDGQPRQLSKAELLEAIRAGRITRETMVWRQGMEGWKPAGEVEVLQSQLAQAAPPPPPPPARFHVLLEGQQQGPLTLDEIARLVREGRITGRTLVWKPGLEGWTEAAKVPELAGLLKQAGPPKPPLKARIREFLLGTWQAETTMDMGGMNMQVKVEVTYYEDGTLKGVQTMTPTVTVPGVPPFLGTTTMVMSGTWKIEPLSEKRFALTETVTFSGVGTMPPMPETKTMKMTIVDRDTMRDEDTGVVFRRVR